MVTYRPVRAKMSVVTALSNLRRTLFSWRLGHALVAKMRHDRILMRGSALAFETLLSIVPLTAVAMAAVRVFGGETTQDELLRYLAAQYVPESASSAIEGVLALVEGLDLSTIGLVGLLALIPVMFSLVDAVELALSDIFRTPRRTHWSRLLLLGSLLTLAPLGSVLTVRYVPFHALAYDHVLTPLLVISGLTYAVFRGVPSVRISGRAAVVGALATGVLLSLAKVGFGLYATHLATSIHLLWGAVAFFPLLLVWVLLSWCLVLFGAELTASLQTELDRLELSPGPARAVTAPRLRRLRRRLLQRRRSKSHPSPPASLR